MRSFVCGSVLESSFRNLSGETIVFKFCTRVGSEAEFTNFSQRESILFRTSQSLASTGLTKS